MNLRGWGKGWPGGDSTLQGAAVGPVPRGSTHLKSGPGHIRYLIEFTVPRIVSCFAPPTTLGLTWYEMLRGVARVCAAQKRIESITKWQMKTAWNTDLEAKIMKWIGIDVSIHWKDIF